MDEPLISAGPSPTFSDSSSRGSSLDTVRPHIEPIEPPGEWVFKDIIHILNLILSIATVALLVIKELKSFS